MARYSEKSMAGISEQVDRLVSQIRILIGEGVSRDDIVSALDIADLRWPLARARVQSVYDELAALEK